MERVNIIKGIFQNHRTADMRSSVAEMRNQKNYAVPTAYDDACDDWEEKD